MKEVYQSIATVLHLQLQQNAGDHDTITTSARLISGCIEQFEPEEEFDIFEFRNIVVSGKKLDYSMAERKV